LHTSPYSSHPRPTPTLFPYTTLFRSKLDAPWEELDMLDPKRRGTYRVSLILFLLITDPHGQVIDQVRDGRQLPDLNIRRAKVLLDKFANIRKLSSKLLRIIILHLIPFLAQIRNIRRPDILPNL